MISFKQYLQERAMNQREFARTLSNHGDTAKVGFEFEMAIPSDSALYRGLDFETEAPDVFMLRDLDHIDELSEYFDANRRKLQDIDSDYGEWVNDAREKYVYDNRDNDHEDLDTHEEELRDEWNDRYRHKYDFKDWISSEFASVYTFLQDYGLDPRFGWDDDTGNDHSTVFVADVEEGDEDHHQEVVFKKIAAELTKFMNEPVKIPRFDSVDKSKEWMIVPDGSIEISGAKSGMTAEVVSPPHDLKTALTKLHTMFKWMSANDCETNSSTGLHINISVPNIKACDPVKLVLFMGDRHVLKQFERLGNTYTRSQVTAIEKEIQASGTLKRTDKAQDLIDAAYSGLNQAKYASVNLKKLQDGYLEFRVAGNTDYHKKFDLVRDTVLRFVTALTIACDRDAERDLYVKKLVRLFGENSTKIVDAEEPSLFDVLENGSATSMAERWQGYNETLKSGGTLDDEAIDDLRRKIIPRIMIELNNNDKRPSSKLRAEMKLFMKRAKKSMQDLVVDDWKDEFREFFQI